MSKQARRRDRKDKELRRRQRRAGRPPQGSGLVNFPARQVGLCSCGALAVVTCPICGPECLRCFLLDAT